MARILVIDDEPVVREYLGEVLRREGHEVEEAASGTEGLAANRRAPADLALVDLVMPGKDGVATVEELRAEHPATTIVIMTGAPPVRWPLSRLYEQSSSLHMLVKPMTEEMLLTTIAEALDPARAGRA